MLPSEIMHELNKSYANGFHHCRCVFKDASAPLESNCYLGPHAWYIKENEASKTKKQDKKEESENKNNKDKHRHSMQRIYTANNSRFVD